MPASLLDAAVQFARVLYAHSLGTPRHAVGAPMLKSITAVVVLFLACAPSSQGQQKPDWQLHIDWASSDTGPVDCADSYRAYPKCLNGRGRACLMLTARSRAAAQSCDEAMHIVLITQCHNGRAQRQLADAGVYRVCSYLRPEVK